jgi:hypothetical protein
MTTGLTTWFWLLSSQLLVGFLMATAISPFTGLQVIIVWLMEMTAVLTFLYWRQKSDSSFPLFPLLAAFHFLSYAPALFWNSWASPSIFDHGSILPESAMTQALTLGLCSLWTIGLGMTIPRFTSRLAGLPIDVIESNAGLHLVRVYAMIGCVLNVIGVPAYLLGEEARTLMIILCSQVPLVAFLFLWHRCLTRKTPAIDWAVALMFVATRVLDSVQTGVLGESAAILFLAGVTYVSVRRQIPWTMLAVTAVIVLFLQVGKGEFRAKYWAEGAAGTLAERFDYWTSSSWSKWGQWFSSGDSETLRELTSQTTSRTSVLTLSALVMAKTPEVVPFQRGVSYEYLLVTFIPRFVWADKPSANDANKFYQVEYGLTRPEDLRGVSIASGFESEAYMNFGWLGVFGISLLVGILFSVLKLHLFSTSNSDFLRAVGLSLLPSIVAIESQMAMYVGGLVQTILLTYILFLPVLRMRRSAASSGMLDIHSPIGGQGEQKTLCLGTNG